MSIYKACDVRGVAGAELNGPLYGKFGRALADLIGAGRTAVVGGDFRESTECYLNELAQGLAMGGVRVKRIGHVPTPVVYFARHHLNCDACAIVTASHNPPQYNGLKFMIGDLPILPEDVDGLRRRVEAGGADAAPSGGTVECVDVREDYERWVAHAAGELAGTHAPSAPMRVVVDAGNGAYSDIAPRVLARLPNVEVVPLFCEADGRFPHRDPNCAVPEHLATLCQTITAHDAALGVAFDGDGDRVAFVDDHGHVLAADEAAFLLLRWLGERVKGRGFVYDLKCSRVVALEAERLCGVPMMERSGHAFIKRRMIAERALFGAEVSGHFFYDALHGGDDGLFSALLVLLMLGGAHRALSDWRSEVPARFITDDLRISWSPRDIPALLDAVRDAFPAAMRSELDGVRVQFSKGWGLLRASITEPKVTLRFEGDSPEARREVIEAFLKPVPELREAVAALLPGRNAGGAA